MTSKQAKEIALRGISYATSTLPLRDTMELMAEVIAAKMTDLSPRQRNSAMAILRRLIQDRLDQP